MTNPPALPYRIGLGYDLHRLEPIAPEGQGRPFILGGVLLEHPLGPVGRSDGDALLHAVTDAILGAIGEPDIGQLYPDSDPKLDGADSTEFLQEAARRMRAAGYELGNLDTVVALQRPKLSPVKDEIRRTIAEKLGVPESAVNMKGKTGEKVGPVGEGIAVEVHAVALLVRTA